MSSALSPIQSGLFPNREGPYLRVLCINIFVRDQNRSLRFFLDQLGFSLVLDENFESGGRWVAVAPPDGSAVLALVSPRRNSEEFKLIGRSRHAVLVTEDVVAKFQEWQSRGVKFHHPPQATLWEESSPVSTMWMETRSHWSAVMILCARSKPSAVRLP
jgi:hypothetical protein